MISIALDTMGGDYAPAEIVKGGVLGGRETGVHLIFVGMPSLLQAELAQHDLSGLDYEIVDAPDVIQMDESPAKAVRRKRNASIVVAAQLVKDGVADAAVTMGHSGAALVAGRWVLGMLPGMDRPALPAPYLGLQPEVTIIDVGGNTDVRPRHLLQFAFMGAAYAEAVVGITNPRIGLLSIGSEPGKGSMLLKETFPLLAESSLNFVGNIEGDDIPAGKADVIVHDGLLGNVVLKLSEGVVEALLHDITSRLEEHLPAESDAIQAVIADVLAANHYSRYGAMPLLGLNGLLLIGHGKSKAPAVVSGLKMAQRAVAGNVLPRLKDAWQRVQESNH